MTTEKMNVHRALAELKILDNRIISEIDLAVFCQANKHSNEKINGISIDDYKKTIQSSYDKINDLIARREALKKAVQLSNATTEVTIAGKTMTRVEAIEMKNHGLELKKILLEQMSRQYNKTLVRIANENGSTLEEKAEKYVIGLYGNKEGTSKTDDFEKVKKDYISRNQYDLIDPIKIKEKIDALRDEIDQFTSEVDAALSVSNAITEITIEY